MNLLCPPSPKLPCCNIPTFPCDKDNVQATSQSPNFHFLGSPHKGQPQVREARGVSDSARAAKLLLPEKESHSELADLCSSTGTSRTSLCYPASDFPHGYSTNGREPEPSACSCLRGPMRSCRHCTQNVIYRYQRKHCLLLRGPQRAGVLAEAFPSTDTAGIPAPAGPQPGTPKTSSVTAATTCFHVPHHLGVEHNKISRFVCKSAERKSAGGCEEAALAW